jgi:hypothetical protein
MYQTRYNQLAQWSSICFLLRYGGGSRLTLEDQTNKNLLELFRLIPSPKVLGGPDEIDRDFDLEGFSNVPIPFSQSASSNPRSSYSVIIPRDPIPFAFALETNQHAELIPSL